LGWDKEFSMKCSEKNHMGSEESHGILPYFLICLTSFIHSFIHSANTEWESALCWGGGKFRKLHPCPWCVLDNGGGQTSCYASSRKRGWPDGLVMCPVSFLWSQWADWAWSVLPEDKRGAPFCGLGAPPRHRSMRRQNTNGGEAEERFCSVPLHSPCFLMLLTWGGLS
jgi:hypothetical protein